MPSIADELDPEFNEQESERERTLDAIAFVRLLLDARERVRADDRRKIMLNRSAVSQIADPWIERGDAFDFAASVGFVAVFALLELDEDPHQVLDRLVRETVEDD